MLPPAKIAGSASSCSGSTRGCERRMKLWRGWPAQPVDPSEQTKAAPRSLRLSAA